MKKEKLQLNFEKENFELNIEKGTLKGLAAPFGVPSKDYRKIVFSKEQFEKQFKKGNVSVKL